MRKKVEPAYSFFGDLFDDLKQFSLELSIYLIKSFHLSFLRFEEGKGKFVSILYKKRGRMAKRFVHSGMAALAAFGVVIAPVVAEEFPGRSVNPWDIPSPSSVLSASTDNPATDTIFSEKNFRDKIIQYIVQEGDTVSTIAEKFNISVDTIRWQNNLKSKDAIKVGQTLEILPITGIAHKVQKGDTVYSIAKKYDTSPQAVVDFPFNTFMNDETFGLAIGQVIIVPDGIMPKEVPWSPIARVRQATPDAGTVSATGNFVWPSSGDITQPFRVYHPGIDIANRSLPPVLAADSGTVVVSGWHPYGYGNHVVIDHGNGYRTLYGHMSVIYVAAGQTVNRGDTIGKVGSTGRSTGPHLHFEVILNGIHINPLNVLK